MTITRFQKTILNWYKNNRRDLPWRNTKDPYKILVSEIMLQQTQVSRVLPKYKEFLKEFPTPQLLVQASDAKLLRVWFGLGYWRRAKYLKETVNIVTKKYHGKFPKDPKILETFPGIGLYTAGALACFAFGDTNAFVDTNIRRIYLHFFFPHGQNVSDKDILPIAQQTIDTLPKTISTREWHYALFDYGALVLKNKTINKQSRHYAKQSAFTGSFRSYRTKTVRHILQSPKGAVPHQQLHAFLKQELKNSPYTPQEVIAALLKDKLIKKLETHYAV